MTNPAWSVQEIEQLYDLPLHELILQAGQVHAKNFPDGDIELATLLSIKTGGCPEDCSYCPQAARYHTGIEATKLMELDEVLEAAKAAKAAGSNRFCMGAAWREPKDRDIEKVAQMIREVKALGLETCATLGMLLVWIITTTILIVAKIFMEPLYKLGPIKTDLIPYNMSEIAACRFVVVELLVWVSQGDKELD